MDKTAKKFLENDMSELDFIGLMADKMDSVDPRQKSKVVHSASVIMLIALAGVLAGSQTWNEVADYGAAKKDLLRVFIPHMNEVPSHDTIRRFFMLVKPEKLEEIYRGWAFNMQKACGKAMDIDGMCRRHLAFDGKTMKDAIDHEQLLAENPDLSAEDVEYERMHIVSLYDTSHGISLGQERVGVKRNELSAIRKLLTDIGLEPGDVVTIDAMGTHADIAGLICEQGADYLLEVKDNQKKLKEHISMVMDTRIKYYPDGTPVVLTAETTDCSHSCTTHRKCHVLNCEELLMKQKEVWPGLSTVGFIDTAITYKDGSGKSDRHYFITSLPINPELIMKHKREHWQIENGLHWQLDVNFNEDRSKKMMTSAQNYSLLTKMTLATLKNESTKLPVNRKRKAAGWNDTLMYSLICQFIKGF